METYLFNWTGYTKTEQSNIFSKFALIIQTTIVFLFKNLNFKNKKKKKKNKKKIRKYSLHNFRICLTNKPTVFLVSLVLALAQSVRLLNDRFSHRHRISTTFTFLYTNKHTLPIT